MEPESRGGWGLREENAGGIYYGSFGHYLNPDMDAQETVYKMSVTASGIAWFWALAARCNLDVPEYYWEGVTRYVKRCILDLHGDPASADAALP